MKESIKQIVIFASGSGSNAEAIITYFKDDPRVEIALVLTNNPQAPVLERAQKLGAASICFNRKAFYEQDHVLHLLISTGPDLIVLAGFLWLFPQKILRAFSDKVINIHPALLPDFGGKGMYGRHVHEAVIASAKKDSGITVHYVTPAYDEGAILFQARTTVTADDTPETLAVRIHALEHLHFPKIIEGLLFTEKGEGQS